MVCDLECSKQSLAVGHIFLVSLAFVTDEHEHCIILLSVGGLPFAHRSLALWVDNVVQPPGVHVFEEFACRSAGCAAEVFRRDVLSVTHHDDFGEAHFLEFWSDDIEMLSLNCPPVAPKFEQSDLWGAVVVTADLHYVLEVEVLQIGCK